MLREKLMVRNDVADRQHGHAEEEDSEGDDWGTGDGEESAQPDEGDEGEAEQSAGV